MNKTVVVFSRKRKNIAPKTRQLECLSDISSLSDTAKTKAGFKNDASQIPFEKLIVWRQKVYRTAEVSLLFLIWFCDIQKRV